MSVENSSAIENLKSKSVRYLAASDAIRARAETFGTSFGPTRFNLENLYGEDYLKAVVKIGLRTRRIEEIIIPRLNKKREHLEQQIEAVSVQVSDIEGRFREINELHLLGYVKSPFLEQAKLEKERALQQVLSITIESTTAEPTTPEIEVLPPPQPEAEEVPYIVAAPRPRFRPLSPQEVAALNSIEADQEKTEVSSPSKKAERPILEEVHSTRLDVINLAVDDPNISLEDIITILGPSSIGSRLNWRQAAMAVVNTFNKLNLRQSRAIEDKVQLTEREAQTLEKLVIFAESHNQKSEHMLVLRLLDTINPKVLDRYNRSSALEKPDFLDKEVAKLLAHYESIELSVEAEIDDITEAEKPNGPGGIDQGIESFNKALEEARQAERVEQSRKGNDKKDIEKRDPEIRVKVKGWIDTLNTMNFPDVTAPQRFLSYFKGFTKSLIDLAMEKGFATTVEGKDHHPHFDWVSVIGLLAFKESNKGQNYRQKHIHELQEIILDELNKWREEQRKLKAQQDQQRTSFSEK